MIIWALFDSGNGSYTNVAKDIPDVVIYPIGLDIENKNGHFINLDLSDYSYLFGDNNLIIASPPCESWSVASAMKDGNACWKQEKGDSLFLSQTPLSKFTIRGHKDYEPDNVQFKFDKSFINRINGELCTYNTIKIIKHFNPKYYIIENPATSRMWEYIEKIIGFNIPHDNLTYYNNYGSITSKPTRFKSNIDLNLKSERIPNEIPFNQVSGYNTRSNIPRKLVEDIFNKVRLLL